jgi:hypothetical protein
LPPSGGKVAVDFSIGTQLYPRRSGRFSSHLDAG